MSLIVIWLMIGCFVSGASIALYARGEFSKPVEQQPNGIEWFFLIVVGCVAISVVWPKIAWDLGRWARKERSNA
jgi:hypothetical protein